MERYVERYVERDRAGKNVFSFFPKRMLSLFWNKKNKVSLSYPSPKSESIFSEYLSFFCASRENASNLGERNRRFLSPRLLFGGELFNVPNISLPQKSKSISHPFLSLQRTIFPALFFSHKERDRAGKNVFCSSPLFFFEEEAKGCFAFLERKKQLGGL